MKKNLSILLITILLSLNACVQTTAFMGPGVTIATSGNIAQASFQYGTNKIIEKQTGKNTLSLITDVIEENKSENEKNQIFFDDLNLRKPDHFLNAADINATKTIGKILIKVDWFRNINFYRCGSFHRFG